MKVLEIVSRTGSNKSFLFVALNDLYPECEVLIHGSPQLSPLCCLPGKLCPKNASCVERLLVRLRAMFDAFSRALIIATLFRYQDRPESLRAGIFWRDVEQDPKLTTVNPSAWAKLRRLAVEAGTTYDVELPAELRRWIPRGVVVPGPDPLAAPPPRSLRGLVRP